jgi:hypothetical protein
LLERGLYGDLKLHNSENPRKRKGPRKDNHPFNHPFSFSFFSDAGVKIYRQIPAMQMALQIFFNSKFFFKQRNARKAPIKFHGSGFFCENVLCLP